MDKIKIRQITTADDSVIAEIIRTNLKKFNLDIPGTAYYDPELDCLSKYYVVQVLRNLNTLIAVPRYKSYI